MSEVHSWHGRSPDWRFQKHLIIKHHTWKNSMAMRAVVLRSSSTAGKAASTSSRAEERSTCSQRNHDTHTHTQCVYSLSQKACVNQTGSTLVTATLGSLTLPPPLAHIYTCESGRNIASNVRADLRMMCKQAASINERIQLSLPVNLLACCCVGLLEARDGLPAHVTHIEQHAHTHNRVTSCFCLTGR